MLDTSAIMWDIIDTCDVQHMCYVSNPICDVSKQG